MTQREPSQEEKNLLMELLSILRRDVVKDLKIFRDAAPDDITHEYMDGFTACSRLILDVVKTLEAKLTN